MWYCTLVRGHHASEHCGSLSDKLPVFLKKDTASKYPNAVLVFDHTGEKTIGKHYMFFYLAFTLNTPLGLICTGRVCQEQTSDVTSMLVCSEKDFLIGFKPVGGKLTEFPSCIEIYFFFDDNLCEDGSFSSLKTVDV